MEIQFSVIIPAYNNLVLLKNAVASVICQEDVSWEIIIVDDSTNTEIEDYVSKWNNKKVRYIHNHPNLGAVKNWNYGLSLAKGKYLIIMHHDECFKDFRKALRVYYERVILGNQIIISDLEIIMNARHLKRMGALHKIREYILKHVPSLLYFYNFIGPVSCLCFSKELITTFNEELVWLVDVDFYYRLFLKSNKKISYCSNIVRSIHGHKGQISQNIDILRKNKDDVKVLCSIPRLSLAQKIFIKLSYLYRKVKYLILKLL